MARIFSKRRLAAVVALTVVVVAWVLWSREPRIKTTGIVPAPAAVQDEPLFRIRVDGKYGFIDRSGSVVLRPQYAHAGGFCEGLAPALDVPEGRWGYVDRTGAWVVPPRFKMAFDFSDGLGLVREEFVAPFGYIDRTGAWILPPQFEGAHPFRSGRAIVGRSTLIGKLKGSIDAAEASDWRWRAIDRSGNDLGSHQMDYSAQFGDEGLRQVWSNRRVGFEDRAGVMVIASQYEETTGFSEGLAAVRLPGQPWGYIDRTGSWVIPPQFGWSNPFRDGLAEVVVNRKAGYIDRTGKWVWEPSE